MSVPNSKQSKISFWPQWLAAFHVYLIAIMAGATTGLMAPLLAKLLSPESPFEVTKEQTTWVASIFSLTTPLGAISGAVTSTFIGSKLALHVCGVYYTFGWLCLICANCIQIVYIALLFNGFGMGTLYSVIPVYIGEIADSKIRSGLMAFAMDGTTMGVLLGNIMGTYLDPWAVGAINLTFTLIYLISFSFFPSSSYHLIRQNKINEAVKSLEWYNRQIRSSEETARLSKCIKDSSSLSFFKFLKQLKTPENRNALIKVTILFNFLPYIGVQTVVEYIQVLFIEAKVTVIAPSSLVILVSCLTIIAGWIASYTSDKFNRKTLLLCACITMALSYIVWGLRYHLLELGFTDPNLQWMAIISAIIYRVCIVMGLMPIILTLMTEILTPNLRQMGSSITCITSSFNIFIVSKCFQFLVDYLTYQYVFYILAVFVLVMAAYVHTFIPETKEKTLPEISSVNKAEIPAESETLLEVLPKPVIQKTS